MMAVTSVAVLARRAITGQGGHDILAADAQVLASRLQQVDNTGTFTFAPTAIHDYLGAF